jgi:aspartate-semialdehyde dehydrogenase
VTARAGFRIAVVGATGALGTEVLAALDEAAFPVRELVLLASEGSLASDVEFRGDAIPVESKLARLRGADLALLCAPPAASLAAAGDALRLEVPAIDLSGALATRVEVPLATGEAAFAGEPLVAVPAGPALAWLRVLAPIHAALGLRRVVATALAAAASAGRTGIEALSTETVALLNQGDAPEPAALGHPIAFDCLPWVGDLAGDGSCRAESELAAVLQRALGGELGVAVTAVRVPTFCGDAASLALETASPAEPAALVDLLRKSAGIEVADADCPPSARAAAGSDRVYVGRVRRDPSRAGGVLLWLAADSLRLAAAQAVRLAAARLLARS